MASAQPGYPPNGSYYQQSQGSQSSRYSSMGPSRYHTPYRSPSMSDMRNAPTPGVHPAPTPAPPAAGSFRGVLMHPNAPGAREWDEYYMKGGTDPAGLVYYYPETVQGFPPSAPQPYPPHIPDRSNERSPYPYQGHQLPPQHQVRERVPSGTYHHHAFQPPPPQHHHHTHSQSLPANSYPYAQPPQQHPIPNHQPFDVRRSPAPQHPPASYGHPGSWPPPQSNSYAPSPISNSPMGSPNRTPSHTTHQLPPSNYDPGVNGQHPSPRPQPTPSPSYQPTPLPSHSHSHSHSHSQPSYPPPTQSDPALPTLPSNSSGLSSSGFGPIPKSPARNSFPALPSTGSTSSIGSNGSHQGRPASSRPLPTPAPPPRSSTTAGPNPSIGQAENGAPQPRQPIDPAAAFAAVRARQEAAAAAEGRQLPSRSSTLPAIPTASPHPALNRPPQLPMPGAKVEGKRPLPSPKGPGPAPVDIKGKGKAKETEADIQAEIHHRPLPSPMKGTFSSATTVSPVAMSPPTDGFSMSSSSPAVDRPNQRPPLPPVPGQPPKSFRTAQDEQRTAAAKEEAQRRMQEKLERFRNHRWKEAGGQEDLQAGSEQAIRNVSTTEDDTADKERTSSHPLQDSHSDAKVKPNSSLAQFPEDDQEEEPIVAHERPEKYDSPKIMPEERNNSSNDSEAISQGSAILPKLGSFRRPLPPRIKSSKSEPESEQSETPLEPSPPEPANRTPSPPKLDSTPTPVKRDPAPPSVRALPQKPQTQPSIRPASAFDSSSRPARSPSAFGSRSHSAFEAARPLPSISTKASEGSTTSINHERPVRLSSPPRFNPSLPEVSTTVKPNASEEVKSGIPLSPSAVERPSYGFRSTTSTPGLTEGGETSSGTSVFTDEVSTQASEEEESSPEDLTPSQSHIRGGGRALPMPPAAPATPQRDVRSPPETPRQRDQPAAVALPRHSMAFRLALEEQDGETGTTAAQPSRSSATAPSSYRNSFPAASNAQRNPSPSETPRRQLPQPSKANTSQRPRNESPSRSSAIDLDDHPPTSLHRNGSFSRSSSSRPTPRINGGSTNGTSTERAAPTTTEAKPSGVSKRFGGSFAQKSAPADDYTIPKSTPRSLPSQPAASSVKADSKPKPSRSNGVTPTVKFSSPPSVPIINLPDEDEEKSSTPTKPSVTITSPPMISVEVVDESTPTTPSRPSPSSNSSSATKAKTSTPATRSGPPPIYRKGSLRCAGCDLLIVGKIVSAMDRRWHPGCFKCSECDELLEHVSSYEHKGRPYCHLDYHDLFAPKCFHCKTAIADERFITVNDPGLDGGSTRYYHELHFFCAECGDPFLHPSASSAAPKGQKPRPHESHHNDLGYTVYHGHAYCETCHVRLRMPKCAGCKKSIRDEVVEALDRKWHFYCFVCKGCKRPFEDPSFFQRGEDPYCDHCYSILIKSEL